MKWSELKRYDRISCVDIEERDAVVRQLNARGYTTEYALGMWKDIQVFGDKTYMTVVDIDGDAFRTHKASDLLLHRNRIRKTKSR